MSHAKWMTMLVLAALGLALVPPGSAQTSDVSLLTQADDATGVPGGAPLLLVRTNVNTINDAVEETVVYLGSVIHSDPVSVDDVLEELLANELIAPEIQLEDHGNSPINQLVLALDQIRGETKASGEQERAFPLILYLAHR